ncbi:MAG: ATP-binding protein [Anaerolineae bacterium]|nr:ATP-binding protein [Anaerolineae bacterium]
MVDKGRMEVSAIDQAQQTLDGADAQLDAVSKRLREVSFLRETGQVLAATLDRDKVLESLMAQVHDYFQVEAASTALWDEESGELVFRAAVGEVPESLVGFRVPADYGAAGRVLRTGEIVGGSETGADERRYSGVDEKTGFCTRALLAAPIVFDGSAIGVLEAINPPGDVFDDDAQRLLSAVADIAAVAIRNAEMYQRALQAGARYESLYNSSLVAVVVSDLEGCILDLNRQAAELFGRSRDQLLGTSFWILLGEAESVVGDVLRELDDTDTYSLESTLRAHDQIRTLEGHFSTISYGVRDAIGWVGFDVSERVALEEMREDTIHTIIHDLRNPLGSVLGSLELIHTAVVEHDATLPILQLLGIGLFSGHKMHRLIDSLLDIGRLESGSTDLEKVAVDPQVLITKAVDQVQPLVLNKQQTLTVQDTADLPSLDVESDLIVRVRTNFLDNAIKYTPMKGHISVCTDLIGREVQFTVSDTGQGVLPADSKRIFDRFTRLENAEHTRGTGLGLAFCKLAVEAHGGRIWAESEPGAGANFHFTLPVERL